MANRLRRRLHVVTPKSIARRDLLYTIVLEIALDFPGG